MVTLSAAAASVRAASSRKTQSPCAREDFMEPHLTSGSGPICRFRSRRRTGRRLHARCRLDGLRTSPKLIPEEGSPPVLPSSNPLSSLHRRFACARLSQPCLPESCPSVSATLTTIAFDDSSLRWLEINNLIVDLEGSSFISRIVLRSAVWTGVTRDTRPIAAIVACGVALELLPCRPEQNFVHVHVFRLAHGEYHHVGKGIGGDRQTLVELAHVLRHVGLGDAVGQFGRHSTGRDNGGADVVRLDLLSQAFGDYAYCRLGCRIDRASRPDDMTGDRRHIDDVTAALRLHVRQRGANAVKHALEVTSIVRSQSCTLPRSSGECGISPALLRMTSMRPCICTVWSTKLVTCSYCVTSVFTAAFSSSASSFASASRRSMRRAPSTSLAPPRPSARAVASPSPLLAPVMTTTLSLILSVIFVPSLFFGCDVPPGVSHPC